MNGPNIHSATGSQQELFLGNEPTTPADHLSETSEAKLATLSDTATISGESNVKADGIDRLARSGSLMNKLRQGFEANLQGGTIAAGAQPTGNGKTVEAAVKTPTLTRKRTESLSERLPKASPPTPVQGGTKAAGAQPTEAATVKTPTITRKRTESRLPTDSPPTRAQARTLELMEFKTKYEQITYLSKLTPDERQSLRREIDSQKGALCMTVKVTEDEGSASIEKLMNLANTRSKIDWYDFSKNDVPAKNKELHEIFDGQQLIPSESGSDSIIHNLLAEICQLHIGDAAKDKMIEYTVTVIKADTKDFTRNACLLLEQLAHLRIESFIKQLDEYKPNQELRATLKEVSSALSSACAELHQARRPYDELEAKETGRLQEKRRGLEDELKNNKAATDEERTVLKAEIKATTDQLNQFIENLPNSEVGKTYFAKSDEIVKRIDSLKAKKLALEKDERFLDIFEAVHTPAADRKKQLQELESRNNALTTKMERLDESINKKSLESSRLDPTIEENQIKRIDNKIVIADLKQQREMLFDECKSVLTKKAALTVSDAPGGLAQRLPTILAETKKLLQTEASADLARQGGNKELSKEIDVAKRGMQYTLEIAGFQPVTLQKFADVDKALKERKA